MISSRFSLSADGLSINADDQPRRGDNMGISWGAVAGLLTSISPIIVPLVGGPVAAILKAVIVENFVTNRHGDAKRQRAIDLVGNLLVVAEDATAKDLVSNPMVAEAVGSIIDLEVALRNAHAKLGAVVADIQAKRASE
jgi:hypothetical protein